MKYYLTNLLVENPDDAMAVRAKVAAALKIPQKSFRYHVDKRISELAAGGCRVRLNVIVDTNEFVRDTSIVFFHEDAKLSIPKAKDDGEIVVIGAGLTGLLCAKVLLDGGAKPVIIEQGPKYEDRETSRGVFERNGIFNPKSNTRLGFGGHAIYTGGYVRFDNTPISKYLQDDMSKRLGDNAILTDETFYMPSSKMKQYLTSLAEEITTRGAAIHYGWEVTKIRTFLGKVKGIEFKDGDVVGQYKASRVIFCGSDDYPAFIETQIKRQIPSKWGVGIVIENRQRKVDAAYYKNDPKRFPAFVEQESFDTKNGFRVDFVSPLNSCSIFPYGTKENSVSIMPGIVDRRINENAYMSLMVSPKSSSGDLGNPLVDIARSSFRSSMPYSCPSESLGDFMANKEPYRYRAIKPTSARGFYLSNLNALIPGPIGDALRYAVAQLRKRYPFFLEDEAAVSGFILRRLPACGKDFAGMPTPSKGFFATLGDGPFPYELSRSAKKGIGLALICLKQG
ncbi:MAG: FAD-dependent oxidoreductase [Bacilli bacterium]|nr:FAD-dependent oxidoreductase [Bacilli bacterium]